MLLLSLILETPPPLQSPITLETSSANVKAFLEQLEPGVSSQPTNMTKMVFAQPNLKIDELVLIKDYNLPPSAWKSGRIINTHPDADRIVRAITSRTFQFSFKGPVNMSRPFPIEEN